MAISTDFLKGRSSVNKLGPLNEKIWKRQLRIFLWGALVKIILMGIATPKH